MIEEDNVVSKVAELMSALDQVKKYRVMLGSFVDIALIAIVWILALQLNNIYLYLGAYPDLFIFQLPGWFRVVLPSIVVAAGWTAANLRVNRKTRAVRTDLWKTQLDEGVPGALKLLSDIDSPAIYREISLAKLGFLLYGAVRIVGYWIPVILLVGISDALFVFFFRFYIDFQSLALAGLLGVLLIRRREILRRFSETWSLDMLLWELRWFNSEFRRAEFKT